MHLASARCSFVCFQALPENPTGKYHLVPANFLGEFYFSERYEYENGLSACIVAKNTKSLATSVISISDSSEHCPYRVENRSNSMTVIFSQDDNNGHPIVLPPMTWTGYAFGDPNGPQKIRAAVTARVEEETELNANTIRKSVPRASYTQGTDGASDKEVLNFQALTRKRNDAYKKLLRSNRSRSFKPNKIGRRKNLPCHKFSDGGGYNELSAEVRIHHGSKVLSFNDSEYHTQLQGANDLGKKSQWQSIGIEAKVRGEERTNSLRTTTTQLTLPQVHGVTLHLVDAEPKEMLSVMLRDFRVFKRQGEIDLCFRLRSFQIDNMLNNAYYPIVLQAVNVAWDPRPDMVSSEEPETYLKKRLREQNENGGSLSDAERGERFRSLTDAHNTSVSTRGQQQELMRSFESGSGSRTGGGESAEENYWDCHELLPQPVFETVIRYLPLSQLLWVPVFHLNLCALKLQVSGTVGWGKLHLTNLKSKFNSMQVDLDFLLNIYELVLSALPEESDSASMKAVEDAYSIVGTKLVVPIANEAGGGGGSDVSSGISYIEKLTVSQTSLDIELNLKQRKKEKKKIIVDDETGEEKEEKEDEKVGDGNFIRGKNNSSCNKDSDKKKQNDNDEDFVDGNLSTLNSMGRSTTSGVSAALLTWIQNIAGNFAHVSPTFTFDQFEERNHFGKTDVLLSKIVSIYKTKLIMQSLKVFGSMNLLGDPFRLFNSVTSGTSAFFTVTRDEILAGGKDGVGGGGKSLVQGVVGGTMSSTAKITGNVANVFSEASGGGTAIQLHSGGAGNGPRHFAEGLMQGGMFFTTTIAKGIGGVVVNPIKGLGRHNPALGFVSGFGSGVVGAIASPIVATFGLTSKVAESVDATTHM